MSFIMRSPWPSHLNLISLALELNIGKNKDVIGDWQVRKAVCSMERHSDGSIFYGGR